MSVDKLVDSTQLDSDLTSVANAIRTKGGTSSQMSFPSGFVSAIENIHTGSTPTGTKEISITENGTTTEDVTDYAYAEIEVAVPASAVDSGTKNITANGTGQDVVGYAAVDVAVPNTYAAGDEGKVVSSGALVAQTSGSTSANGTVDTTLINSLSVSVPASAVVSGTLTVDSSGTKDVTNYQYASVPAGTAGTPTATKGTVSNHAVTVTPSVTNSAGWVASETKTGTAVTVQASELDSGTKSITANGTNQDVVGYAAVDVAVQPNVGTKSITTNGTYTASSDNLDGYSEVTVNVSGGGVAKWQRPSGWPDYDSLNLQTTQEESIYFTYDNRSKGSWIGLYAMGAYKVQRVSINNGVVTVISSVDKNSDSSYNDVIPSDAGDWVCYRIIPQSGAHLTKVFHWNSLAGNSQGQSFFKQSCVERYGYLPNITDISTEWAYRGWAVRSVVSETLYGLPTNTKMTWQGTYSRMDGIRNFVTDSVVNINSFNNCGTLLYKDWSKMKLPSTTTSLKNIIANALLPDCDLSGSTIGTVTTCQSMAEGARLIESFKFPSADYSEVTNTNSMFRYCYQLRIIDLPSSFTCSLGQYWATSTESLQYIILRANAVVPLSATTNIQDAIFQRGGARVFVPSAQIANYKTASNWVTLYTSYPDMFGAIEGSAFE